MKKKPFKNIFISSIHQNAGKTTVSLGLYQAFRRRKMKTAFMKPVGQQYVSVGDLKIDKDSYLMGEVFHTWRKFKQMSPVTIGRGFTEKYINHPKKNSLRKKITDSFEGLIKGKEAIIVEGTGHAGVGAVIDCSNADVASILGSKVIIVSEGGIGRSIDEIILNKALFDLNGVEVLGVIVNKVHPNKYEKIKRAVSKGLANKGLKLLGVIPLDPLLSAPTIEQIRQHFHLQVLCGQKGCARRVNNVIVAAMEPHNMINYIKDGTLVITSGDRVDNILTVVSTHLVSEGKKSLRVSGIILTGGLVPAPKVIEILRKSQIPVLITNDDTYRVAANVEQLICKIQKTDKDKIVEAATLVKKYVDVKGILGQF